jgi:SpoVK/Ycf46/Vps4 family AAA+-type ATPase
MRDSVVKVKQKDAEEEHEDAEGEETEGEKVDEVVERVRQDPDLEQHEQRLLSCIVDPVSLSTTFSQVHLPEHTVDAVRTIVSLPLLHPAAFQQGILKEHGMTGCLLFGPPGTGKTLVVRALAKEAGCRMLIISPSDVMDMYVGEGEKLVKAVFSLARRLSPCVVFLDEMDALFGARVSGRESGGAFAHRGVITEFMQEMDGLKSSREDRVIVIGATNRPFDLDDAVLRRVPRRLLVDLPGEKEREEILKILLRDEMLAPEIDLRALAMKTESFSGSDLKHLCVSAALDAVKENVQVPWKPDVLKISSASELITPPEVASLDTASASQISGTETRTETQADAQEPSLEEPAVEPSPHVRVIYARHFTKALKEITPSSSESLGSLADLRKWNEEFGEGRKDKKRHQVWGKGRFGFINKTVPTQEDGRVTANCAPHSSQSLIE